MTTELLQPPEKQSDAPDKPGVRRRPPRRKIRRSGVRLRQDSWPVLAKWSAQPETPLLSWKFNEYNEKSNADKSSDGDNRRVDRKKRLLVSSRKLAAGLWRLRSPEIEGQKSVGDHFGANVHCRQVNRVHSSSAKDMLLRADPKHLQKFPNPEMEGATKWNPEGPKESDEIKQVFGQSKPLHHRENSNRMISALETELEQARARIDHLESSRRSSKKKLEQFLQKLSEERATWRSKEHEKIRVMINDLKSELIHEKKGRQRLEIANSKLADELADAKAIMKRYVQEYQKERKARELVEEVCDELAKEIGEDEAEVEAIKRESIKLREEVEDERRMLQMAEVWREERVQMKLVDAKVMLEEKYVQMNSIIENLETFVKSLSGCEKLDSAAKDQAEGFWQAAAAVSMQDVRELKYEPPNSDDIFSAFKDVNGGKLNCKDVDGSSTASCLSRVNKGGYTESSEVEEDASEWETVSHPGDQGSYFSPDGSDVSGRYSVSQNRRDEMPTMDVNEVESKVRQMMNGKVPNGGGRHLIKGCMEWPSNAQKNSLKARLLEARIQSQKVQLRQVLKQEI